jgi:hypothetical protein
MQQHRTMQLLRIKKKKQIKRTMPRNKQQPNKPIYLLRETHTKTSTIGSTDLRLRGASIVSEDRIKGL